MNYRKTISLVIVAAFLIYASTVVYFMAAQNDGNKNSTYSWVPASQVKPGQWTKITDQDFAPANKTEVFFVGWVGCHVAAMDSWLIYYVLSHYGIIFTYQYHTSDPYRTPPNTPGLLFEGVKIPKTSPVIFDYIYLYNEYLNESLLPIPQPMNYSLSPSIATYMGLMELKEFEPQWVYNIAVTYNVPIVGQYKTPPHVATMLIVTGPNGTWLLIGPSYSPSAIDTLTPEEVMQQLMTGTNQQLMQAVMQFWQVLNESMGEMSVTQATIQTSS
jgi:hypothetical protein